MKVEVKCRPLARAKKLIECVIHGVADDSQKYRGDALQYNNSCGIVGELVSTPDSHVTHSAKRLTR